MKLFTFWAITTSTHQAGPLAGLLYEARHSGTLRASSAKDAARQFRGTMSKGSEVLSFVAEVSP